MAGKKELTNDFSLSWSTNKVLDWCPRSLYWKAYGSWEGWSYNLEKTDPRRLSYTLKKGRSLAGLVGSLVHEAAANVLFGCSRGLEFPGTHRREGYAREAVRQLHQAVDESNQGLYWKSPKKHPMVHEVFYSDHELLEKVKAAEAKLLACLDALWRNGHMQRVGRRVKEGGAEIAAVEDLEYVEFPVSILAEPDPRRWVEGAEPPDYGNFLRIKVWVVPDLVVRFHSGRYLIPDWKTGERSDQDIGQLGLYAWWLGGKHQVEAHDIAVVLVYLGSFEERIQIASNDDIEAARDRIAETAERVRCYLVDGDIGRNEPKPIEEFEQLAADDRRCGWCEYRRLCDRG